MNKQITINYGGETAFPIKLSKLLKKMEKKPKLEFICHAAEKIFHKKMQVTGFSAVTSQTFSEFKRLFPQHIKKTQNSCALMYWTKNLPKHLDPSVLDDRQFRMEFLKWAIEKYGDQEIIFHFENFD